MNLLDESVHSGQYDPLNDKQDLYFLNQHFEMNE
jgi:hypothetical protein